MEIWDTRCQSVADKAGFSSSLCAAPLLSGRSACTYHVTLFLHVPHSGRGGYATSHLFVVILTFWSLRGEHTAHAVQLFYTCVFNRGQFKPDSNQ